MIRRATFSDIPRIIDFLAFEYEKTHYARTGVCQIDANEAKLFLRNAIHRHGYKHIGATWVEVAEAPGGLISGLIVGTLHRVYTIGNKLMATDLFWVVNAFSSPSDAVALMRNMHTWAWSCPDVIEIRCGATAIIQNPERASQLFAALGMEPYGNIYRVERE